MRCQNSRCTTDPYHRGDCVCGPVDVPVTQSLPAEWQEVVERIIHGVGGIAITPFALSAAASLDIKPKPVAWLEGLPTEPGPCCLAFSWKDPAEWTTAYGHLRESGQLSVSGITTETAGLHWKHQPAPLLQPPS